MPKNAEIERFVVWATPITQNGDEKIVTGQLRPNSDLENLGSNSSVGHEQISKRHLPRKRHGKFGRKRTFNDFLSLLKTPHMGGG